MEIHTTVLIIGDPQRLFLENQVDLIQPTPYVCMDVMTGIHQAAQGQYGIIALDIQGLALKLGAILTSLREVSDARIVLLCQIYEEPIARRYVNDVSRGQSLADDYLICPVNLSRWLTRSGQSPDLDDVVNDRRDILVDAQEIDIEQRLRELERLATEDDLTGLKNRRYVREFCRQILDYAENEKGRVTLLIYDIDDFKRYNDDYGHATGDRILCEAATLMRRCCRSHDVVARIGGDEFAVVFWDDPNPEQPAEQADRRNAQKDHPAEAIFIAKRFQRELEHSDLSGLGAGGKGELTISGGLARYPVDALTVDDLFEKADMALLEAKRSGKNRIALVGSPIVEDSSGD